MPALLAPSTGVESPFSATQSESTTIWSTTTTAQSQISQRVQPSSRRAIGRPQAAALGASGAAGSAGAGLLSSSALLGPGSSPSPSSPSSVAGGALSGGAGGG